MYYVYVLRSLKNGRKYIGLTGRNPQTRFQEHQLGVNQWTGQNGPFELVRVEEYSEKNFAQRREKFLKSGHGREVLKTLLPTNNIPTQLIRGGRSSIG